MGTLIQLAAVVRALALHRRRIVPSVRAAQRRWAATAAAIPEPGRRDAALAALSDKRRNAEATAVFALLAPRRHRAGALAAMTALQTAVDYLDSLDEAGGDLEGGLSLHRALAGAVGTGTRLEQPAGDDEYLRALLAECAARLAALPAIDAVRPRLLEAVLRCGEGQARTHAAAPRGAGDVEGLRAWAEEMARSGKTPGGYLWWELAAAGSSSVAAHALIAAAADPRTEPAEADRIEAAYFPPVGALTVLLDDLVDRAADARAGEHSYLAYCSDPGFAAARFGLLADRAAVAVAPLRRRPTHAAILAGVAAFYLSDPRAEGAWATAIGGRLLESLGATTGILTAALRSAPGR